MTQTKLYFLTNRDSVLVKKTGDFISLLTEDDLKENGINCDNCKLCGKVEENKTSVISLYVGTIPEGFSSKSEVPCVKRDELLNMSLRPGDKLYIRQLLENRCDIDMVVIYNDEGKLVTAYSKRKIPFIIAFFKHLHTINHHRRLVRRNCFKVGLYWQGLIHDLSKYSPTEFWVGVKYYQGDRSPNVAERMNTGYSTAWMHHKGRNKHHHEYWTDYSPATGNTLEFMEMPRRYFVESVMDRIAASMVYRGNSYTDSAALDYLLTRDSERFMNKKNHEDMVFILTMLAEKGEKETFSYIKKEYLK